MLCFVLLPVLLAATWLALWPVGGVEREVNAPLLSGVSYGVGGSDCYAAHLPLFSPFFASQEVTDLFW